MSNELGIQDKEDEESRRWFFFPTSTYSCSQEFALFVKDFHSSVEYFSYMGQLAHAADTTRKIARDALRDFKGEDKDQDSDEATAIKKYERFGGLSVRHITNVTVDAFLWYISNIAQRVLLKKPHMLKTKEQVRIDEIVEFSTKRDLIKFLVDRKVSRLAYGGLSEIEDYLSDTFGLALFSDQLQRRRVRFFVEVRNINVHNRSKANAIFLSRTEDYREVACSESEAVMLRLKIFDLCEALMLAAMAFDRACCSKFKISRKSVAAHIASAEISREIDFHHRMHMHASLSGMK